MRPSRKECRGVQKECRGRPPKKECRGLRGPLTSEVRGHRRIRKERLGRSGREGGRNQEREPTPHSEEER